MYLRCRLYTSMSSVTCSHSDGSEHTHQMVCHTWSPDLMNPAATQGKRVPEDLSEWIKAQYLHITSHQHSFNVFTRPSALTSGLVNFSKPAQLCASLSVVISSFPSCWFISKRNTSLVQPLERSRVILLTWSIFPLRPPGLPPKIASLINLQLLWVSFSFHGDGSVSDRLQRNTSLCHIITGSFSWCLNGPMYLEAHVLDDISACQRWGGGFHQRLQKHWKDAQKEKWLPKTETSAEGSWSQRVPWCVLISSSVWSAVGGAVFLHHPDRMFVLTLENTPE